MPKQNKDDNNIWLIGAGILATIIGAAGTFMLSSNSSNKKGNGHSMTSSSSSPPRKPCGCGMKKH